LFAKNDQKKTIDSRGVNRQGHDDMGADPVAIQMMKKVLSS